MQDSSLNSNHGQIFRCNICKVDVHNSLSFTQHLASHKHLKLKRAVDEQRRAEEKCGIYVRGYPSHLGRDEVLKYFSYFGNIIWSHFGHNFALLDYSEPQAVQKVIRRPHQLGGRPLTIRYREARPARPSKPEDVSLSSMDDLRNIKTMRDQILTLIHYLQGPFSTVLIPKCNQICHDLLKVLRSGFPMCQIYPFGSSITGLCFFNSDIDIYVSGIRKSNDEDIAYLFTLRRILNNSQCFKNIFVIGQAKIPILKCIHIPTNTNCDINIRNMLGVCNSRLISYYLNVDPKLKEMMLVIKYWARLHKITGQNHLFTNYSFCMLIIFYLQGNPYHLPSVKYLQDDKSFANFQEMWNGGFKTMTAFCPHIKSTSLLELLSNFFSYYADFDYATFIICPYLGKPVKKSDFKDPDSLPGYFNAYKEAIKKPGTKPLKVEASICIQDPFEHTRNVTPIVSDFTVNIFIKFCRYAKKLAEEGEEGFLYKLFNQTPPNVEVQKLTQNNFIQFGIQMGSQYAYLSKNVKEDASDRMHRIKELWFESVKNFTVIVLRDFLNIKFEDEEVGSSNKKQKMDDHSDVHTNLGVVLATYKCAGKVNVWHSRKVLKKSNDKDENIKGLVERETELTNQMLEMYKKIVQLNNIIEFNITLEKKIEPAQVIFSLSKINSYKKAFRSFGEFFANKFGSWFDTYEKEMNQNCST